MFQDVELSMYNNMEIAVKLVMFGCIFSLAMASWIPSSEVVEDTEATEDVKEVNEAHHE